MNIETIIQAFVFGIAFGCGACTVAFLTSIGNRRRHEENHDQLKLRNKLLEDSNSILRIIASCHVDAKRRQYEIDIKAEKEAKAANQESMSLQQIAKLPAGSVGKINQVDAWRICEVLKRYEYQIFKKEGEP